MLAKTFKNVPLPTAASLSAAPRAVIEFTGLDLAGPSYEGRVFLNNPTAGPDTPTAPEQGYAGSFHVYGYWSGAASERPQHSQGGSSQAKLPVRRNIPATEAVRRAAAEGPTVTVTVVPVLPDVEEGGTGDVLPVDGVVIHTDVGETQ